MNQPAMLPAAPATVEVLSERLTQLSGGLASAEVPIEDTDWWLREAGAHLIRTTRLYSELAAWAASPVPNLSPAAVAPGSTPTPGRHRRHRTPPW
jgi:hypothetical protein